MDAIVFKDLFTQKREYQFIYAKNDRKNILESYIKNNGS